MGDTINDANRRQRLHAMASGGTAGVEAFDAAQAASQRYQQEAVQSALSTGWHPGNALVAADLAGEAQGWTAPYVRDAQLGGSLVGEQVGYDRSAYDSYLARGEEALDLRRRAMAHEQTMAGYDRRLRDAEHAEKLRSTRAGTAGYGGSGMGKEDLETYLRGVGMMAQEREAAEQGRKSRMAAQRARMIEQAAARLEEGAAKRQLPDQVRSVLARLGVVSGDSASDTARKRMAVAAMLERAGMDKTAAAGRQAASEASQDAAARQKGPDLVAKYLQAVSPVFEFESGRAAQKADEQFRVLADEDRFAREAAIAGGLDPALALGMFPSDPGDVASRMADLEEQRNIALTGHPDGELGAMEDALDRSKTEWDATALQTAQESGLSYDYVKEVADEFNLSSPEQVPQQLGKIAMMEQAVVQMMNEDDDVSVPEDAIAVLMNDPEAGLTEADVKYLLKRFGNEDLSYALEDRGMASTSEDGY